MTKCGIGPEFSIVAVLSGIVTGGLTHLYSDRFVISDIPYWALAIAGFVFIATGTAVYVYSLRIFNRGYRNEQLVTVGPYSVVRHPIYAAWILLIYPGIILFFRSWLMFFVPLIAYISFKASIHKEEEALRDRFGPAYLDYRSKVGELFPHSIFWRDKPHTDKE